jgi:hypothetical protein
MLKMEPNGTVDSQFGVEPNAAAAWAPEDDISPQAESAAATSPPETGSGEPSAKRRREEKERTRVSRACDRCKK